MILNHPCLVNSTPIGRIVNRFSKDLYTVDEQLVVSGRSYLATMTSVISTIFVVTAVTPKFLFGLAPIFIFYVHQQAFFTMSYRELKRVSHHIQFLLPEVIHSIFCSHFDARHSLTPLPDHQYTHFLERRSMVY